MLKWAMKPCLLMNKQHNNIKINVMKSSMHNETKRIKAKNNVVPYLQCYKERNNSRMPKALSWKAMHLWNKASRSRKQWHSSTPLTMQRKTTQHQKQFCEKNYKWNKTSLKQKKQQCYSPIPTMQTKQATTPKAILWEILHYNKLESKYKNLTPYFQCCKERSYMMRPKALPWKASPTIGQSKFKKNYREHKVHKTWTGWKQW